MKFNFKKIVSVFTSTVMITSTLALAAAANAPAPFVTGGALNNSVVVVGSSSLATDDIAAGVVKSYINGKITSTGSGSSNVEGGVLEDEITLGAGVVVGKIKANLTDSEVPSLLDDSFDWDDGSGSETYNFHEAIELLNSTLKPITSLDDNDLTGVALSNDKAIGYRLVFEDNIDTSKVSANTTDDADDLYLSILGKSYQITGLTNSSVTVVTSEEKAVKAGDSVTVAGKTVTINNVFSNSIEANGEIISVSGGSKKLANGLRIDVTDIGYHDNAPESSVAIVKIGEDISKTYNTGDEYIGQDKDDPIWVWKIVNPGYTNGYIGVQYDHKETRAKDNIVTVGQSYALPEGYAKVNLVGTTDVTYDDFTASFDDSTDLWNQTSTSSTANIQNAKVLIIEGPNKDSFTVGGHDTNKIYLVTESQTSGLYNSNFGQIAAYYEDVNKDVSDVVRARYGTQINFTANGTKAASPLATIKVGDTDLNISMSVASGEPTLIIANSDASSNNITLDIGGTAQTGNITAGTFEWLGGTTEATSKENAESADVSVNGNAVGTKDNDVMDRYGTIVKTPNSNSDKDVVEFSVPDAQVYAKVSVTGSAVAPTNSGILIVKDNEASSLIGKNLIVVGGSCINTVAAKLLGSNTPLCGAQWESATGAGAGSFVINSYAYEGKIATLVAGYNQVDTENAANYLNTHTIDTTAGKKYKGTTASADALVVA